MWVDRMLQKAKRSAAGRLGCRVSIALSRGRGFYPAWGAPQRRDRLVGLQCQWLGAVEECLGHKKQPGFKS